MCMCMWVWGVGCGWWACVVGGEVGWDVWLVCVCVGVGG